MDSKTSTNDEALDSLIDAMIGQWEQSGMSYDQCSKAMKTAIDKAKEPVTILEWVAIAKKDSAGRRKYSDDIFEPEAVKNVVLDLLKKKQIVRLGRQTFCSHLVVGEMVSAIDKVMIWEGAICNIEDIAELLLHYATIPKTNIKNFIEEQIVFKAMDTMDSLVLMGEGEFIHYTILETCCYYSHEALSGRWPSTKSVKKNELFEFVNRVNFTGMDNQYQGCSIKKIKECLEHAAVREHVLKTLEKDQIVTVNDDVVTQYKKPDKYLWLEE